MALYKILTDVARIAKAEDELLLCSFVLVVTVDWGQRGCYEDSIFWTLSWTAC